MRSRSLCSVALLTLALAACRSNPTPEAGGEAGERRDPEARKPEQRQLDPEAIRSANITATTIGGAARACAAPSGDWYLHLSDIHLGTTVTAQDPNGDTALELWQATKAALRHHIGGKNPPRFILYTGDLPDHSPDHGDLHTTNVKAVLADLKSIAGSIPLIYMPGNNDALDWDYATFTSAEGQTPLSVAGWSGPALNTPATGDAAQGYASASPVPGLRVLGLNTVMFSAKYPCAHQVEGTPTCTSTQDAEVEAQLDWLEAELKTAGEAGEKVILAMHIPPGVDAYASPATMWKDSAWQDRFLGIVDASPATIVSLAFGHTHLDELRRLYDASGEKISLIGLSAPGITPGHGNNPGFKAISYDENFVIRDALTWYASASSPEAGDFRYRPDNCYRYTEVFECAPKADLASCLGAMDLCTLAGRMDTIYKVERGEFEVGAPGYYDAAPGIEVKPGDAAPAACP